MPTVDLKVKVEGFDTEGQNIDTQSNKCMCRVSEDDITGMPVYGVRINELTGLLFDPFNDIDNGKIPTTFRKVKQTCYEFYKSYLKTRNHAWFRQAERNFTY